MNCLTEHRANFVHQPTKVTQLISIIESSWIETTTNGSKDVHQSQLHRGLRVRPILAKIVVGNTDIIRVTIRGGRGPESHRRSTFSVVAALVPPAQQMAKRSRPSSDEASKNTRWLQ